MSFFKHLSLFQKIILGITTLLVLASLPIYAYKSVYQSNNSDFDVYYKASQRLNTTQSNNLYNLKLDGGSPFRYPPPTLIFFKPLAFLAHDLCRFFWFLAQWLSFAFGFYFLYLSLCLIKKNKHSAFWITTLSLLFVFRLCLDTFTIGQVSSLMFFGFSLGLWAYLKNKPWLAGAGVFIPTILKLSPGILFALFLTEKKIFIQKSLGCALAIFIIFNILLLLWLDLNYNQLQNLYTAWFSVVLQDASYFDASHYGSQSLKSFLLRSVNHDWITRPVANAMYFYISLLVCISILSIWFLKQAKDLRIKGMYFALALMACFWFMPETFKYSQTVLAFPIALILAGPIGTLELFSLLFCAFSISFAGLDIYGKVLFFWLQNTSMPFWASCFIGLILFKQILQKTIVAISMPWPSKSTHTEVSVIVPISLNNSLIHFKNLKTILLNLEIFLKQKYNNKFEFLFIHHGKNISEEHKNDLILENSTWIDLKANAQINLESWLAIRTGITHSKGKILYFINAEQPCETFFFQNAIKELKDGADFVRANRRFLESEFKIPVRVLPYVYGRHILALIFNSILKFCFGIVTSDSQSANFVINRSTALKIFSHLHLESFFCFTEISLLCEKQKLKVKDLPCRVIFLKEKRIKRILSEIFILLKDICILFWRNLNKYYDRFYNTSQKITADDWGMSQGVNNGILELAQLGVIKRVSLLANGPYLKHSLQELLNIKELETGLHFNITYGRPLSPKTRVPSLLQQKGPYKDYFYPASKLFLKVIRSIVTNKKALFQEIQIELEAQLNALKEQGVTVNYLDGHHHIHMLPGVITNCANILKGNVEIRFIRCPLDFKLFFTKKLPIVILSFLQKKNLKKYGFKTYSFVYPQISDFQDFGRYCQKISQTENAEILVHPAAKNEDTLEWKDSYNENRVHEYETLKKLWLISK
ncbi:MAG: ChbG/HpnK family deacetylase [Deltaproteobacteria bacterium]|nr:ChbG/HpnK family deacetylase [Deltaproteobacteria bacterium]